jgi:5-methylcytosine-specific restriction protein B
VFRFAAEIKQGDLVVAAQGGQVLGVGKIEGDYYYAEDAEETRHQRPVTWLSTEEWRLPTPEGLQTTIWRLKKDIANLIAVEEHLLAPIKHEASNDVHPVAKLTGVAGEIQAVLERKGQVILYGPPGTGKTYWAERAVRDLAAHSRFGAPFDALDEATREVLTEGSPEMRPCIRLCCFHPAYGYEDFLEAYRPDVEGGQMHFVERDGIFKKLCEDAAKDPRPFYLVIDEINRGDIPRIFGELLTVIEKDKRGKLITLPLTGEPFAVPPNVFIVGTMNTADRSIALLDAALRRRFGFIELMPDSSTLGSAVAGNIPLAKWLDALNRRVLEHVGKDARNLQVGHSYFLESESPIGEFKAFAQVILEDVVPLLEEYCYGDFEALEKILGSGLVNREKQSVRRDLFEPGNEEALDQALLQPSPEISTAVETVSLDSVLLPETEDEGDNAEEDL